MMLDDRDHRPYPTPHLPLYRADVAARRRRPPAHPNDELSRLLALSREQAHERPERVAAAIGLLAFVIVACGAALVAWAVLG